MRTTPENITELKLNEVFVFGSNLHGIHTGGAAKIAVQKFAATMGQPVGIQGQSYAIPTMCSINTIIENIDLFIAHAKANPSKIFLVTEIGCGIAGYAVEEIAPLFDEAIGVENIHLPESFWKILN